MKDIDELRDELIKIEKSINNLSDNYNIKVELEETEIIDKKNEIKKYKYKVLAVIPERIIMIRR